MKLIPEIKNLTYTEHLKQLNLTTLTFRHIRGHMIEVCKKINRIYDNRITGNLLALKHKATANARENKYMLNLKKI